MEFSCKLTNVPQESIEALRKMFPRDSFFIATKIDGKEVFIAEVKRHPDCPQELFEEVFGSWLR